MDDTASLQRRLTFRSIGWNMMEPCVLMTPTVGNQRNLDVSSDAAWSTGHSAIHSLVTWSEESFSSMIDSVDGQASSVNPCVWTH